MINYYFLKKYREIDSQLDSIKKKKDSISLTSEEQVSLAKQELELLKKQQSLKHHMAETNHDEIRTQLDGLSKHSIDVEVNL